MVDLNEEIQIETGDSIYNPVENVRYSVTSYIYNLDFKTKVAYLKPIFPFGTSKRDFSITIKSMVDLKYKLIKQKRG